MKLDAFIFLYIKTVLERGWQNWQ